MRGGILIVPFFLLQVFLIYRFLGTVPHLEDSALHVVRVSSAQRPSPSPLPSRSATPANEEGDVLSSLLALIEKTGAAVKLQNQQLAAERKFLTVSESSKLLKSVTQAKLPVYIASYNLWNVNDHWEERMKRTAAMMKELNPDVIAFQEVRTLDRQSALNLVSPYQLASEGVSLVSGATWIPTSCRVQLTVLHENLPQYKWAVFSPMASFQDGTQEGVAIFSKHPILEVSSSDLSVPVGSDRNTRGLLRARIAQPSGESGEPVVWEMYSTHLTYDEHQQCAMVTKLVDELDRFSQQGPSDMLQVIAGDMNTYLTFEWPMDFIMDPYSPISTYQANPCREPFEQWRKIHPKSSRAAVPYADIWDEAFPRNKDGRLPHSTEQLEMQALGHTFPVFKSSPQTNCRPDRVIRRLVPGVEVLLVKTFGMVTSKTPPTHLSDHLGVFLGLDLDARSQNRK